MRGEGVGLSTANLSATLPGARYHFTLHDPRGLIAAAAGSDGATPIPVPLFEGEVAEYYLTLSVYHRENDPCGRMHLPCRYKTVRRGGMNMLTVLRCAQVYVSIVRYKLATAGATCACFPEM